MKRLTKKNEFGDYVGSNLLDDECLCRGLSFDEINEMTECFNKLGKLEDIEEKLGKFGIPLLIPLKALFDGIYIVDEKGEIEWEPVSAIDQNMVILGFLGTVENGVRKGTYGYGYEDYGISWALTKEELL